GDQLIIKPMITCAIGQPDNRLSLSKLYKSSLDADHLYVPRFISFADPGHVDQGHRHAIDTHPRFDDIAGGAGGIVDDRAILSAKKVHQGRLASIGSAADSDAHPLVKL